MILSMSKAEKRNFRLYATRNTSKDDLKFMLLFDFIERNFGFEENRFLVKYPQIKKTQLSNLKSHLYKQVLTSLRGLYVSHFNELDIREKIDFALILQSKGFTELALKQLEKAFDLAHKGGHNIIVLEITEIAKNIETQYFTRALVSRVGMLTKRSSSAERRVSYSVTFSNLFLEVFGLYLKNGYVRDEEEYLSAKRFLNARMVHYVPNELGFEEKNNLYSAMVWYHLIVQDFVMNYKYAKLWLDLFDENPVLIDTRKELYLKAQNNYLIALHNLRNYKRFDMALTRFVNERDLHRGNDGTAWIYDFYYFSNVVNRYYLEGRFEEGTRIVPEILQFIEDSRARLDDHRIMNLYYKIACMYFGAGDNRKTIFYLNFVIQFSRNTLRDDIQSFA